MLKRDAFQGAFFCLSKESGQKRLLKLMAEGLFCDADVSKIGIKRGK